MSKPQSGNQTEESLVALEALLFEAEDKDADAFKKASDNPSINWARRFCADVLYMHSRHYLKVNFVEEIAAAHARATGETVADLPYRDYFTAPEPFDDNLELAKALLGSAVVLFPKHGAAWLNLGIAYFREKDWQKAERAFTRGTQHGGIISGYSYWFLADTLWELGKKDSAARNYILALDVAPEVLGIMAARAADRLRDAGQIDSALIVYDRALRYSHTHVPEFVQLPMEHGYAISLARFDPKPAEVIESDSPEALKVMGCRAGIWKINERYYGVPYELGEPYAVTVTISGLTARRWSTPIEKLIATNNALGRAAAAVTKRTLRGIWYRGLRRQIISADHPDDIRHGSAEKLGGLAEPSTDGLYDSLGLFYAVYASEDGRFFAVPMRMEPFSSFEIGPLDLDQSGWRAAIDRLVSAAPMIYRYGYPLLKRALPGVTRRFERRLVKNAESVETLIKLVHGEIEGESASQ